MSRYIPTNSTKIASKKSPAVAYVYTSPRGKAVVVAYFGKAIKPTAHYSFKDRAQAMAYAAKWLQEMDAMQARKDAYKAEQQAKRDAGHGFTVGTVLSGSWGYDQTNIEFYEVTKVIGKATVEIREIAREQIETLSMQGKCVPVPGQYLGAAQTRRVNSYGRVKLHTSCSLSKADTIESNGKVIGYKPCHWTAYA
jgi:hypothetical protein